jgi:hypothetical protein
VGAAGAGADRAPSFAQLYPLAISVDENATLVENAFQKKWRIRLDPVEASNIHPASGRILKAPERGHPGDVPGKRHEQIQIGAGVLVATRKRAVENSQSDHALGAKDATKLSQDLPVAAQVLVLAGIQTQPARSRAPPADGPLCHCPAQRPLVDVQTACQVLNRPHIAIIGLLYVRYKLIFGFAVL